MDIMTLNDNFRKSLLGGKVMLTRGIYSKGKLAINDILNNVKTFNNFNNFFTYLFYSSNFCI